MSYLYVSSESGILYSALSASLRTCQVGMSYSTATNPQGLRAFHCHSLGLLVSPPWPEPCWSRSWGPAGHPTTRQMHEGQESQDRTSSPSLAASLLALFLPWSSSSSLSFGTRGAWLRHCVPSVTDLGAFFFSGSCGAHRHQCKGPFRRR